MGRFMPFQKTAIDIDRNCGGTRGGHKVGRRDKHGLYTREAGWEQLKAKLCYQFRCSGDKERHQQ